MESGAYMVQPKLGPEPGKNKVLSNRVNANGKIQKPQLLMRGNAISGAPIISGIIQFASPTNAGIMTPKIIIKPCMVIS